jgi:hypothetical protein
VERYGRVGKATDDNIIWRMHFACWIPKATKHSEYVVRIACAWQRLQERAYMLRYTYVACLLVLLSMNTLVSSLFLSTLSPYSLRLERGRSGLRQLWAHCEVSLGSLPIYCAKRKGQRRKSRVIIYTPNAFHTQSEIRTASSGPSRAVGTHTAVQTVITLNRPRRDKLSHSCVI